jgi:hypothetical protein
MNGGRNQSLEKEKGSQRWSEIWIWSARYSYGKAQSGLKLECQLTIDGGCLLSSDSHRRMEIAFTFFLKGLKGA